MKPVNVYAVAGQSKFNRFHGLILFWCVLILIIDGYDLAVVGAALPASRQPADRQQAGPPGTQPLQRRSCL